MKQCIAPEPVIFDSKKPVVFLGGAIDMGAAPLWQTEVASSLANLDVVFLNPRRLIWNSGIKQSADTPEFLTQVNWELDGIEQSDLVFFYFPASSLAPISLLELGLCAGLKKKVIVCAEQGYYRRGNIEVLCLRSGLRLFADFSEALSALNLEIVSLVHWRNSV